MNSSLKRLAHLEPFILRTWPLLKYVIHVTWLYKKLFLLVALNELVFSKNIFHGINPEIEKRKIKLSIDFTWNLALGRDNVNKETAKDRGVTTWYAYALTKGKPPSFVYHMPAKHDGLPPGILFQSAFSSPFPFLFLTFKKIKLKNKW